MIKGNISLEFNELKSCFLEKEPWIFTGTIRENILFNKEYNEELYYKTLYSCDLN